MKRRLSKIILCALIMGAFSFVSLVNPYAKEEVFTANNDYLFLSIDQYDPLGNVETGKSWTYSGADSSTITDIFLSTYLPELEYVPCYVQGWDGWVSSSDSELSAGSLRLAKFFGDDTGVLFDNDIIISKISVVCVVGFQDGITVILPEVPNFYNSVLQFNGEFLDPEQYTLVRRRSAVTNYTMDYYPYLSFDYQQYSFEYTFKTPLKVSVSDNAKFGHTMICDWSGYGYDGFHVFFGHSGFLIDYSTVTDYENGIVGNNNVVIGQLKQEAAEIKDKLTSSIVLPGGEEVEDVLEIVNGQSVQGIANYLDILHSSLNADFRGVLLTMVLTSLAIAFCGYALHGKR